jgi:hypothetical protein
MKAMKVMRLGRRGRDSKKEKSELDISIKFGILNKFLIQILLMDIQKL